MGPGGRGNRSDGTGGVGGYLQHDAGSWVHHYERKIFYHVQNSCRGFDTLAKAG